ncbi:MAG: protease HtpX [Woeseiaceae bacterium]
MNNKKTTFYLVFVTLLALLANVFISLNILGVEHVLSFTHIGFSNLIFIILFISLTGAFSAFIFADLIARFMLGVTLIQQPSTYLEKWLFTSVARQSRQLGIPTPNIGVFYASDLNAFTTGRGQNNAMLAVSSGLLETLDQDELEAVIGHELAHIENGDMVSLALAQGLVFSLTELPARLFGYVIDALILRGSNHGGIAYLFVYWLSMFLMGLLPHFIVMWFCRQREYYADHMSASLNGGEKMISALERLSQNKLSSSWLKQRTAFGFTTLVLEGLVGLGSIKQIFSSHPPLNKRINEIEKSEFNSNQLE